MLGRSSDVVGERDQQEISVRIKRRQVGAKDLEKIYDIRSGSQQSASVLTLFSDQHQGVPRSAEGSEMGLNLFIARSARALGLGGPITHCQRMNLRRGPVTHQRHALGGEFVL